MLAVHGAVARKPVALCCQHFQHARFLGENARSVQFSRANGRKHDAGPMYETISEQPVFDVGRRLKSIVTLRRDRHLHNEYRRHAFSASSNIQQQYLTLERTD